MKMRKKSLKITEEKQKVIFVNINFVNSKIGKVGIEMIYMIKRRHAVLWVEKDTT